MSGSEVTYDSTLRSITFPDNYVWGMQKIETTSAQLGFRTTVTHKISRQVSIFGSANLGGYYYNADGSSLTRVNFPVVAPPVDVFDSRSEDSKDGVGFTTGIDGGLNWNLSHNFSVKAYGGFNWYSDQVYYKNPQNPAEPVSHLATDDAWEVHVGLNVSYKF